jgi:disulfide bond formation protein DsbB
MPVERRVRLLAGSLVLIGLGLGITVSSWWFLLVTFVGVNLVQSSFTGFCPAESMLGRGAQRRTEQPTLHG